MTLGRRGKSHIVMPTLHLLGLYRFIEKTLFWI